MSLISKPVRHTVCGTNVIFKSVDKGRDHTEIALWCPTCKCECSRNELNEPWESTLVGMSDPPIT